MSTNLKPTSRFYLTQFCGPVRDDEGDRRKLQITQNNMSYGGRNDQEVGFVNVTKEEALELATALLEWVQDQRETCL